MIYTLPDRGNFVFRFGIKFEVQGDKTTPVLLKFTLDKGGIVWERLAELNPVFNLAENKKQELANVSLHAYKESLRNSSKRGKKLSVGDRVFCKSLNIRGLIVSEPNNQSYEIQTDLGNMTVAKDTLSASR